MKKVFLISIVIIFLIPILFIGMLFLFPEKPASSKKILEILNKEFAGNDFIDNNETYFKLIDFLEENKSQIIKEDNNSDYNIFSGRNALNKQTNLSDSILLEYTSIISELPKNDRITIEMSNNGISIFLFRIDYLNYLYVYHEYFINNPKRENRRNFIHKEKIFDGKYHYIVCIMDAFNIIDPNNFSPN